MLGHAGDDPEVVSAARARAQAWLADHRSVDPTLVPVALTIAAEHGDRQFFDALRFAALRERDRHDRRLLLQLPQLAGGELLLQRHQSLIAARRSAACRRETGTVRSAMPDSLSRYVPLKKLSMPDLLNISINRAPA